MSKLLFSETQKFSQKWLLLFMCITIVGIMALMIYLLIQHKIGVLPVIIVTCIQLVIISLLLSFKLKTLYYADKIEYSFAPFLRTIQTIKKEDIESIALITYAPLNDFGGWGVRISKKYGSGYTTAGDKGVHIVLKNKRQILLGTQQPETVAGILAELQA